MVTTLAAADRNNGVFQMVGSDLYFIKTRNTSGAAVEVHERTAASGYHDGPGVVTALVAADRDNGVFRIVGPDLFFIETSNTASGRVEIYEYTGASGYQDSTRFVTSIASSEQLNGWFQLG